MEIRQAEGWEIFEEAAELARRGEEFALATVVWRQGPSSGQPGARAIIAASGEISGWIGGACAEPAVIREAQRAIRDGESRLLLLGTAEQFSGAVPEGMTAIPIACQSEGALEVFVEPVLPTPRVFIVGRSPMAATLLDLVQALGWQGELVESTQLGAAGLDHRAIVVIATQGHGDEETVETAVAASPAYVGLVASKRRGESVLGYLADRGVPPDQLQRVHVPAGLDLGATSHREIAVAILAELVQLRAAGKFRRDQPVGGATVKNVLDPVCGMSVAPDRTNHPYEYAGLTYYFCGAGCRAVFEKDPTAFVALPTKPEA